MENDPNNPYGNPGGDGSNVQETPPDNDDYSWWELVGGVWRRMTDSAPYTGAESS
jgi:hypothetical protein